ncbi:hypothetical protein AAKU58_004381 [Oxalobacteraceae bacterium GrIS 1.18]
MKNFLTWFGGLFLIFTITFVILMAYGAYDKAKWDDFSSDYARGLVTGLNELSRNQFDSYWRENKSITSEQKEVVLKSVSALGTLDKIDSVEIYSYGNNVSIAGQGVTHFYVYDVKTTFSNGPVLFRFWFKIKKNKLEVLDMHIKAGTSM